MARRARPGLPFIGIDKVEIIKGPASVLYGTDALGGVINIIEEQPDISHKKVYIEPDVEFYASQIHRAVFETATSGYVLYNIAAGIETTFKSKPLHIYISGRNLANTAYYAHLSRLKYYGLYNPGFNFMVTCKLYLYPN